MHFLFDLLCNLLKAVIRYTLCGKNTIEDQRPGIPREIATGMETSRVFEQLRTVIQEIRTSGLLFQMSDDLQPKLSIENAAGHIDDIVYLRDLLQQAQDALKAARQRQVG